MLKRFLPILLNLLSGICLLSCNDDFDENSVRDITDHITFSVGEGWTDTDGSVSRSMTDTDKGTLVKVIPFAVEGSTDSLYLHVFEKDLNQEPQYLSRGKMLGDKQLYATMSVTGYQYPKSAVWEDVLPELKPELMHNVKFNFINYTFVKDSLVQKEYLWPGNKYKVRFFGVSPYGTGTISSSDATGAPTLSYTVPGGSTAQRDLMIGTTGELSGRSQESAQFTLKHILSAISFVEAADMQEGKIESIAIQNVYSGGTYDLNSGTWTLKSTKYTYQFDLSKEIECIEGNPITQNEKKQTFFLIPQTLPKDAKIVIQYIPIGYSESVNIQIPFTGELEQGKAYTYQISNKNLKVEATLNVTAPSNFELYGGSAHTYKMGTIYIKSEASLISSDSKSWGLGYPKLGVNYYDYNPATKDYDIKLDNPPSWLSNALPSSPSAEKNYTIFYNSSENIAKSTEHDDALKTAALKGSSTERYNLANPTGNSGDMNTANCYIINSPGYYSLPLVYGNALKNGTYNTELNNNATFNFSDPSAINTDNDILGPYPVAGRIGVDGEYELVQVKDKAYIYDYRPEGKTTEDYITSTELLWQDAPGLISNLKLSDDHKRILFDIANDNVRQGNALIAVKSGDHYLWAWHIWVTDYNRSDDKLVDNQYYFMPVNLGWVDESFRIDSEKSVRLNITQTYFPENSEDVIIKVPAKKVIAGRSIYWLEGSPFAAVSSGTLYDIDGNRINVRAEALYQSADPALDKLKAILQNPGVVHTARYGLPISNLWAWVRRKNQTLYSSEYKLVKSLYDPCPPGYCIVPPFALKVFSKDRFTRQEESMNYNPTSEYMGAVELYCNGNGEGGTILFSNAGYYSGQSVLNDGNPRILNIGRLSSNFKADGSYFILLKKPDISYYSVSSSYIYHLPIRAMREPTK